jgi:putative peptidoglycan lipid II flippase
MPKPAISPAPPTASALAPAAGGHIARSAALVAGLFAVDKVLALIRDAVIGHAFGASAELDAYYAAFELPDGLFTIIAGSAMATTLIPVLSAHVIRDDREGAWQLVSTVINLALLLVIGVSVVAAIFAPQIIQAVAPGFEPRRTVLATGLMRLVLLQTVLFTVSGILMGALRAYQHFFLPALAPIAYTLSRIAGTVFLAPRWGIFGLAWGGLVGAVIYFLVLVPGLVRYGARWWATLHHPDLKPVLTLMGPRVLGLGATYLTFVLPTFLGSRLAVGAISAYEYGWRLMQFPETIIGTALGITVFPTLAALANAGDPHGLRNTASWALRLVLTLAVPAAVGLLVLGRPLTALFLQRGAFDATVTERVMWGLQFFALGLVTHSALEVVSGLFYAQRDMWTPLWAALGGLAVNAGLGWALLPILSHGAIALSNSLGAGLQVVVLLLLARRKLGGIVEDSLMTTLVRTVAASLLMAIAIVALRTLMHGMPLALMAVGGLGLGAAVYLAAALLMGSQELRELPQLLLQRR